MNKVAYRLARFKLMDDMRYNLNRPGVSSLRRCECGMWTRGCFTKCICCQAIELRNLELNQNPEKDSGNNTVGVTAHCECGHVFCDDVVHCKPQPKRKEEQEVITNPVFVVKGRLMTNYIFNDRILLADAINKPRFIGFKYEDGTKAVHARLYKCNQSNQIFTSTVGEILTDYEVLTPTAVLFKEIDNG